MVFDLVRALDVPLTVEIATHIYLAILTDTGSFHYSSISPRTFDICRQTLEAGVDPVLVARNVYDSNSMGRLKLFGVGAERMQIDTSGRIAIVYLDHEMAREAGGTYEDTEGLINLPLTVKEIQAVVFFKQIEGDEYRVSMRSKGDIDIGAVAKEFGGGGHRNAAGCTVTGAIDALQTDVRREDGGRRRKAGGWTACSSSTSQSARRRTTSSLACGGSSASAASDTRARSIRPRAASCRSSSGRATRLAQFLSAADKVYEATVRLGVETDTCDSLGRTVGVPHDGPFPAREAIDRALDEFRGTFLQQPPVYSAKKIGGKRSHRLARARQEGAVLSALHPLAALPAPALVTAHAIDIVDLRGRQSHPRGGLLGRLLRPVAGARPRRAAGHRRASRRRCRRTRSGDATIAVAVPLAIVERDRGAAIAALRGPGARAPRTAPRSFSPRKARGGRATAVISGLRTLPAGALPTGTRPTRAPAEPRRASGCSIAGGNLIGVAEAARTPGLLHPVR